MANVHVHFGDVLVTGETLWEGKSHYNPMRYRGRSFSLFRAWEISSFDYVVHSTRAIQHYNRHLALFMALHPRLGAESLLCFEPEILQRVFEIALGSH